jgi:hypothetical protein
MTIEQRLQDVEQEVADLKADLARRVRTEALEIVGMNGRVRAKLEALADGATLTLYDGAGKVRALLTVKPDGTVLALYDKTSKGGVGLSMGDAGPGLVMGTAAADGVSVPRVALGAVTEAAALHLFDAEGVPVCTIP